MINLPNIAHASIRAHPEAEQVQYQHDGGALVTIWALVNRRPLDAEFAGSIEAGRFRYTIFVANSVTLGVTDPQVQKDTIQVIKQIGDPGMTECRVVQILSQDAGAYTLVVVF